MLGSSGESGDFIPERFGESELWSFDKNVFRAFSLRLKFLGLGFRALGP